MSKIYLLGALLIFFIYGCKKSSSAPIVPVCDPQISYTGKVKQVFISNCTASGCHDGVNYPSLADYTTAKDASLQIRDAVSRNIMPKTGKLSDIDKAAILCWIDNGAKNN